MIKAGLSRMFSVGFAAGKAAAFGAAPALVLALGLGVATTALAAEPGDPFLLGRLNEIGGALTRLVGNRPTALLQVKNDGGPALNLVVPAGKAPFQVSAGAGNVANLDADLVDGKSASAFVASARYKRESAVDAGTVIGDGTFVAEQACDAGDVLLAGGPANVSATSTLLESFPAPGNLNAWKVRINKNGQADNFNVVVLCADQ